MQVRKLIRLLNEMVENNPAMKYKDVCIDTHLGRDKSSYYRYYSVADIETHWCVWNAEESVNENQREVVVIGNL